MTYSTGTSYDFSPFERSSFSRQAFPHTVSGAVALTLSILVGGWILYIHSASVKASPPATPTPAARPYQAPAGTPAARPASNNYVALLDPTYSLDDMPAALAQSSPLGTKFQSSVPAPATTTVENVQSVPGPAVVSQQFAQNIPLPAPRPPELAVMPAARSARTS